MTQAPYYCFGKINLDYKFRYFNVGGTSYKSYQHWQQIMLSERFQRFDFGESKNQEVYNQKTPPEIDLSKIKHVPIAMF